MRSDERSANFRFTVEKFWEDASETRSSHRHLLGMALRCSPRPRLQYNIKSTLMAGIGLSMLITLNGCGGATPSGTVAQPTYQGAPQLHVFNGTETYTYNLTQANISTGVGSGTDYTPASRTISVTKYDSAGDFEFKVTDQFGQGAGAVPEIQDYEVAQDSSGNLNFIGNLTSGGGVERASTPPIFITGYWTNSTMYNTTGIPLLPTGNFSNTGQVIAVTNVTIGLGTFQNVYQIAVNYTVDLKTYTGTVFFDPKLGAIISGDETVKNTSDGSTTTFHEELTGYTNVSP